MEKPPVTVQQRSAVIIGDKMEFIFARIIVDGNIMELIYYNAIEDYEYESKFINMALVYFTQ